ncbi:hypothetical protein WKW50_24890 [Ochrobactrum sp. GPK 3]|uniref:hypothetical protein n=1 Tax=Brucella sp. 22210 TaxID=3453892 RepID=UPI0031385AEA
MYLIPLTDADICSACSDDEYVTASDDDDEYFSADEGGFIPRTPLRSSLSSGTYASLRSSGTFGSLRSSGTFSSARKKKKSKSVLIVEDAWTVDDSQPREKYLAKKHVPVNAASMKNYFMWRNLIKTGIHPVKAATTAGIKLRFHPLKQKKHINVYTLSLSIEHRVVFSLQEAERIVTVLNIGGHSYP